MPGQELGKPLPFDVDEEFCDECYHEKYKEDFDFENDESRYDDERLNKFDSYEAPYRFPVAIN